MAKASAGKAKKCELLSVRHALLVRLVLGRELARCAWLWLCFYVGFYRFDTELQLQSQYG